MARALGRLLPDGRLHLQEGPIDLVIGAEGPGARDAFRAAAEAFDGLLATLVAELPTLRQPVGDTPPVLAGPVARRMAAAVWPHRLDVITPMAAVAGAVADHVLAAMARVPGLLVAHVNDGGDIGLYLAPAQRLRVGLVQSLARGVPEGMVTIRAEDPVRGLATSGWRGRSFSLGIAEAVTVLAVDAAAADAAATLIANAVDADHPAIRRAPARSIDPDSDLGDRLVTVEVGPLPGPVLAAALDHGAALAARFEGRGLIHGALLALGGEIRVVGGMPAAVLAAPG